MWVYGGFMHRSVGGLVLYCCGLFRWIRWMTSESYDFNIEIWSSTIVESSKYKCQYPSRVFYIILLYKVPEEIDGRRASD